MQMLRSFAPNAFAYGLASWSWLGIQDKTPRFTTAFGDVFLESLDGWWLLDTIEGTLTLRWSNAVDLYAELDSPAGREEILLEDILVEALGRGVTPGDDEVLAFMPHPAAGGRLSAESCSPLRFELALSLAGQVHGELLRAAAQAPSPMLWAGEPAGRAPEPQPQHAGWPAEEQHAVWAAEEQHAGWAAQPEPAPSPWASTPAAGPSWFPLSH
ncbi:hypothetical protein [Xylanimonas sp. McL0601]|uniref:hypothetical protein n=1 Tax=Xylanimonas sp. McL0601 TaxID=3414739 RepID=UPI003CF92490